MIASIRQIVSLIETTDGKEVTVDSIKPTASSIERTNGNVVMRSIGAIVVLTKVNASKGVIVDSTVTKDLAFAMRDSIEVKNSKELNDLIEAIASIEVNDLLIVTRDGKEAMTAVNWRKMKGHLISIHGNLALIGHIFLKKTVRM